MADSAAAKVKIVNAALIELGQPPAYSGGTETQLGGIIDTLWPNLEAVIATAYDFSYFRKTAEAQGLSGTPANGWSKGFQLPGDRIGDPLAILSQAGPSEIYLRHFMLEAGNIYANVSRLWVRYRVKGDPSQWDAGFTAAFTLALAGKLAVPLLQDEDLAAVKLADAWGAARENFGGGLFGKLIAVNRAAQPQGRGFMDDDPLTAARFR
jgi:hypothetical protein